MERRVFAWNKSPLAFLVALIAVSACLPGARAPKVPPQRTLEVRGAEVGGGGSKAPFGVVFAGPRGATVDPSEVSIVFNRPMRSLELAGEESAPPVKIEPAVKGAFRWLGTSAVVFVPEKALPRATAFKVTVPGATKALDGSTLGEDYVFEFETARPRLAYATPGEGSTHLTPEHAFELRFDQPVDTKDVARATKLVAGEDMELAFSIERPKPDVPMLVRLVPKAPLPLASKIEIRVAASLRGTEGPLESGEEHVTHVETYGPLAVKDVTCSRTDKALCAPHGGVYVGLSNRVRFKDLRAHLRIDPPIPIHWPKGRSDDDEVDWVSVPVNLGPAAGYRLTVTAGLKDEYGQVLGKPRVEALETDDEPADVRIGLSGEVFEAAKAGGKKIPVASINVPSYELLTASADERGMMKLRRPASTFDERWSSAEGLSGAKKRTVRASGARNVHALEEVSIDRLLAPNKGRGVLVVGTSRPSPRPGRGPIRDLRFVTVTDLAISARLSRFGSLVIVTRLSDGRPVPGATVAVRDASGDEIASVETDAGGFASIPPEKMQPITSRGAIDPGLVLFARAGGDWTFRAAQETVMHADPPYLDLAARMSTFGMLFADRGIYKTGETIRVKGVFRKPLARGMETPAGRGVTLHATDAEGATIFEHEAKLGAFGEVSAAIPIAKTAHLGRIQIDATIEGEEREEWQPHAAWTSVEVAAYRPAEFKTSVELDRPSYVRGDKASFAAHGDYLFGAPMTGGKVRYTVTRSSAWFAPPGAEGFVVDDEAYRWALPDASPAGGRIQNGDGALDEKGVFGASVALALPKQVGPESVSVEAEIEDLSRQTVASQTTVLVHPAEFYVGLARPKDVFPANGAPIHADVSAIEPSGRRRGGVPVHVELVRRTWKTVTEAVGDEDLHYESRPVDEIATSCDATTGADGKGACDLVPPSAGQYLVRATSQDRRKNAIAASYAVYVVGEGAKVSWPVYDGARLDLVTDKKSYQVGDTATVLIQSPYAEAEAIVTIERQGIHERRHTVLNGPMPTVRVPVTKDLWPNAYVAVELIKPRTTPPKPKGQDVGAPSYRIGWAEIDVDPESRRLEVEVRPKKKELSPGEEIDVDLVVRGRDKKGVRADVAFYAVDEGVLMLTGYKTPDPLPVFAAKRALSVAPIESRDDLARVLRLGGPPGVDKGDEGGGGGEEGEGTSMRQDFRTTAYFQPSVVTGADGRAHVRFKLPDSLSTYRLMAVATATDHRFGFGQDDVTTSRPLMARPALPRFLRAGDTIDAGVIVTSKAKSAQRVEVTLETKGLEVAGDARRTVDLPAQGSVEVKWPIAAPTAGSATLAFTARSPAGSDSVKVTRDVAVPLSLEAVALYGDTESAVAEKLGDMRRIRSDTGSLDLRVASTALVGLEDGVEALVEYPYGCTEQLTSKTIPLVALAGLAKDYGIDVGPKASALADDAIAKILKNQRGDGSFGYWPDSEDADVWVTAHALWGLSLAKARGRAVPPEAIENAARWLRDQIAACGLGGGAPRRGGRFRCDDDDVLLAAQTFVVDVLATVGKADAGYESRLFERRAKMPLFARALLAHAMVTSKMRSEDANELVRDVESYLRVTPGGATVAENVGGKYAPLLDSEARTTAMVLRALVAVDPKHPLAARIAKGLLAARRGGAWRSTQENAWALVALDDYRKAQEAAPPDYDARIFFGDDMVLEAPFHGRSTKSQGATFPIGRIAGRAGEALSFQVKGRGRLFYEARLRYAKKELPGSPLDRGFFVKKLVRSVRPEALSSALRTIPERSAASASASDLVLVDLLVVTPEPREQVVIDDPLPAGLEPVQAALATTAHDLDVTDPGGEGDELDRDGARDVDARAIGQTFQRSWYHRELHDDRVLTFVDRMAAGMYHYRYLARATTPGRFVVPPTRSECMYEPETFGRTAASTFEVKAK